jgi:carbon-monoxide dehydrogenase medium subunit
MKPPAFRYVAARSIDEAIDVLAKNDGEAKVLAGGQSLTPMLNFRLARPEVLVDINRVPGLDAIEKSKTGLTIGALTRHRMIETSPLVRERQPLLAAAAKQVGHLAIRNRGTFGGSLAHNDPAAEFPMVALLLDARITAKGRSGERTIDAKDFFVGLLTSSLKPEEIVTSVEIPDLPRGTGWGFEELSRRPGDFAIAAVCVAVTLQSGTCSAARISMAGVGSTAVRASNAEKMLAGRKIDDALLKKVAAAAQGDCDPNGDVHASADFRRHLVGILAERALRSALDRAA